MKKAYVYIMVNKTLATIYIGVTNNIVKRVYEHRIEKGSEFTTKYNIKRLLYLEEHNNIEDAIKREKQLKNWHRPWKIDLIKDNNPKFEDLSHDWYE